MLHIQTGVSNWLEAVDRMPPMTLVKSVTVQELAEARAHNANIFTMLRYVNDGMQQVSPSDTEATRESRARSWFNAFIDGTFLDGSTAGVPHWQATNIIGWWNEYYADSQTPAEKELWWRQERTAARIWRDEYRNGPHKAKLGFIRLAIAAAAVGNDIPMQSAQTAVQFDCILDYHAYDKYFDGGERDPLSWKFHCGRWLTMDDQFRAAGYTVPWLFGEAGPYGSAVTGWRHETIFGGDVARYVAAVRTWVREIKATPAYRGGRVLGFALFTTGGGSIWQWFETKQPELNALADMLAQEWTAVPPPPPPPPPVDPPPPPVPPPGDNLLDNWSFENGWYHPGNVPELQIPNEWQFGYYDESTPNPYDPAEWSKFKRPEVWTLPKTQLPPAEWPLFIRDGDYVLKPFGDNKSIYFWLEQTLSLPAGTKRFTPWTFGDLVKDYAGGVKIWANDPQGRDGLVRVLVNGQQLGEWVSLVPGQWNAPTWDITAAGSVTLRIEFMCPFPLDNAGLFCDGWTLAMAGVEPPPPPPPVEPPPSNLNAYLWQQSKAQPALNLHPNLYLWRLANEQGYSVLYTETAVNYEGKQYVIQQGRKPGAVDRLYVFTSGEPVRWMDEGQLPPPPLPHVERPLGLDISHHQGSMNWAKAKAAGAYFAMIKSSQRTNLTDPQFLINWQGAKAAGLLVAPYHYYQAQYDPIAQAEYFVNTVRAAAGASDLPYALDVEEGGSAAGFSDNVKACLNRIHQLTGRKPLLYAGIYYLNNYLKTVTPAQADLWLANWTTRPEPNMPREWSGWKFWQFAVAPRGAEFGAQSVNIDLNRWYSTLASLYEYARGD